MYIDREAAVTCQLNKLQFAEYMYFIHTYFFVLIKQELLRTYIKLLQFYWSIKFTS